MPWHGQRAMLLDQQKQPLSRLDFLQFARLRVGGEEDFPRNIVHLKGKGKKNKYFLWALQQLNSTTACPASPSHREEPGKAQLTGGGEGTEMSVSTALRARFREIKLFNAPTSRRLPGVLSWFYSLASPWRTQREIFNFTARHIKQHGLADEWEPLLTSVAPSRARSSRARKGSRPRPAVQKNRPPAAILARPRRHFGPPPPRGPAEGPAARARGGKKKY